MEKNKEEIYLKAYIFITSALLIVRDVVGIGLNKYIFLLIASGFMAIGSIESMIYMLVFSFPLFCGLPAAHIRLVAIVLYLVKKKGKLLPGQFFLSIFVIILELIASNWYPSVSMGDIIGYLSAPVMLFLFLWDHYDSYEIDYKKCLELFLVGFGVVCFVLMANAFVKAPSHFLTNFAQGLFRASVTETDKTAEGVVIKMNANTMAYFCCVCTALSLTLAKHESMEKTNKTAIYYFATFIFAAIGALSLSRSGILVLAITIALFVISSMTSVRGTILSIIVSILLIGGGYAFIQASPALYNSLYARFTDSSMATAGRRTELFQAYMNVFLNNERFKWLGTGVVEYRTMTNIWNSMHNATQQILVCMGIPGFIVFILGLFIPFNRERKSMRIPFFYWIPLVSLLAFVQTIQFLSPTILMFPIIMCLFSLKLFLSENRVNTQGLEGNTKE